MPRAEGEASALPPMCVCVRVRAQVRDFYRIELKGIAAENPGWDDAVCGVLGALARLVGKKAQHVPQALTPKQLAAIVGSVDVKSPSLMTIGAYIATQVIDGDRASRRLRSTSAFASRFETLKRLVASSASASLSAVPSDLSTRVVSCGGAASAGSFLMRRSARSCGKMSSRSMRESFSIVCLRSSA